MNHTNCELLDLSDWMIFVWRLDHHSTRNDGKLKWYHCYVVRIIDYHYLADKHSWKAGMYKYRYSTSSDCACIPTAQVWTSKTSIVGRGSEFVALTLIIILEPRIETTENIGPSIMR